MTTHHLAVQRAGLVTSVGLTSEQCCAAFRAKISNPTMTHFMDSGGEWIMAHQVPMERPWRGLTKLAKMAAMAVEEAMQEIPKKTWSHLPLLLCVAETERPGRTAGLDDQLFLQVQAELGATFAPQSAVVAEGRVGVAVALGQARGLMVKAKIPRVLVVATDSLLSWPTLSHYDRQDRLLTARNANGFMPGEAAGALLVGVPEGRAGELICTGIGFGQEAAHLESGEPLRADGLSQALRACLSEAGCQMHDMDFRITDNSGEQYYFREAALALSRTLRQRKEEFEIWHPAECTGETGAASGVAAIATVHAACSKRYSRGPNALAHLGNDAGKRAALSLQYRMTP